MVAFLFVFYLNYNSKQMQTVARGVKSTVLMMAIAIAAVFSSCKKDEETKPKDNNVVTTDASIAQSFLNQTYGSHDKQKFDIYLPANRSAATTRVLFLIHGGGWSSGSKEDFNEMLPGLRNVFPDYAFVTIGYRLYQNGLHRFPTQEQDVKACIEHVLGRGDIYHISDKFAIWGGSAGAHLALLYAYKHGPQSYAPKAVIEFAGPTALMELYNETPSAEIRAMLTFIVGNPNNSQEMYEQSSPITFVTPQSTPTLIVHGDADEVVHISQAYHLRDALQAHGVNHVVKIYPNEGHGMSAGANTLAFLEMVAFLNEKMQ
jgi:acetyl esterase/lipase